jgi:hypothetical protein
MTEPLDLAVARALMHWRLIERAMHSHEQWSMSYNGVVVGATRFIRGDRVSFVGHFPPLCPLQQPEPQVTLLCGEEPVRVISLSEPLDEDGSQVWWDLTLDKPVPVGE